MKGPWPGLWLDHAARQFGRQSALFFPALKAAGGTLDEIVLDTEIGFYTTWGIADDVLRVHQSMASLTALPRPPTPAHVTPGSPDRRRPP